MLSARDPMRRRQPVERPLDIVALEMLVSITQALLAGILLSLATQLGGDARAYGLPVPGLLAVLGIAVGAGWLIWLTGGSGWVMASVCLATSILLGALWLLALQDAALPRLDPLVGLIAVACALYGLAAGVFLDGPHRAHWKGGVSQPHRGVPQTRSTPARFSPPVQKVVDEHLSDLHLPQVNLPQVSLPSVSIPKAKKGTSDVDAGAAPGVGGGLAVAAEVAPQPATSPGDVEPAPEVGRSEEPATQTQETATPTAEAPTEAVAAPVAPPAEDDRPEPAADADADAPTAAADVPTADPEAPTEPVARPPVQWPRPIEPRGHTGAHTVDPDV